MGYALVGPVLMIGMLSLWRYTDNTEAEFRTITEKVDTLDTKFDIKFDGLNNLLTDNLIAINREIGGLKGNIGELKGQAQARNPTN